MSDSISDYKYRIDQLIPTGKTLIRKFNAALVEFPNDFQNIEYENNKMSLNFELLHLPITVRIILEPQMIKEFKGSFVFICQEFTEVKKPKEVELLKYQFDSIGNIYVNDENGMSFVGFFNHFKRQILINWETRNIPLLFDENSDNS